MQAMADSNLAMCAFEIETDTSIEPLSCIVESELGAVKTGWTEQLAAIRSVLEGGNTPGVTR
jgi:flagellar biosynthesis/type III secretory pathway protein FliH